jgi:HD-like signal output (HDOD) protein
MLGLDPHAALKRTLGDLELPVFSQTTQAVLRDLRDPDTPMSRIGDRLATDPGLSVTVLRLANRASNGLRRPIVDAAHASRLLGRAEIESMVIAAAVRKALPDAMAPGFDPVRFWRDAALRATVVKRVAEVADAANARTAFTGALLQDMAVPLLVTANPGGYHDLLDADDVDLHGRERGRYGWDHAEVAGWLCASWSLPEDLTGLIVQHHHDDAPMALRVAEHAMQADPEPFIEEARTHLGLVPERSQALLEAAQADARDLQAALAA